MSDHTYPPEGRDFVDSNELELLAEINRRHFESRYHDNATALRANIIQKLASCAGLRNGNSWAVFHFDPYELDISTVADIANRRRVAIILARVSCPGPGPSHGPAIRIISREMIQTETEAKFIHVDYSLNPNNGSKYLVGAFTPRGETEPPQFPLLPEDDRPPVTNGPDGETPLFNVNEGVMYFFTPLLAEAKTPMFSQIIGDKIALAEPFGNGADMEDQHYALSIGETLYAEIANRVPESHSTAA